MHSISDSQLISILEATQLVPEKILIQIRRQSREIPQDGLATRLVAEGILTASVIEQLEKLIGSMEDLFVASELRVQTEKKDGIYSLSRERKKDILFARQVITEGLCTVDDVNNCFAEQSEILKTRSKELRIGQIMVKNHLIPVDRFVNIHKEVEQKASGEDLVRLIEENRSLRAVINGENISFIESYIPENFGPYRILQEVARGGMGVVYKAWDEKLRRPVAVKVLKAWESPPLEEVQRFHREARLAASLSHPNIVNIYEAGVADGVHYFTMDYVEGETLSEYLSRGLPTARESLIIIREIALALSYAHSRRIIHRDVKPGNIMLDSARRALLTDFGLAKGLNSGSVHLTQSGATIGTPAYMSPEQAKGDTEIDARSDIYSLGTVLYEMLTGKPPFEGNVGLILSDVISKDPISPSRINSNIHPDIETICLKAMQKDKEHRYQNAKEMADDMDRFLIGATIKTRNITYFGRLWKKTIKNIHWVIPVIVILCSVFTFLIWHWTETSHNYRQAEEYYKDGLHAISEKKHQNAMKFFYRAGKVPYFYQQIKKTLQEAADNLIVDGKEDWNNFQKQELLLEKERALALKKIEEAETLQQKNKVFIEMQNFQTRQERNYINLIRIAKKFREVLTLDPSNPYAKQMLVQVKQKVFAKIANSENSKILWDYAFYLNEDLDSLEKHEGVLTISTTETGTAYLFAYEEVFFHHVAIPWQRYQKINSALLHGKTINYEETFVSDTSLNTKELIFNKESLLGSIPLQANHLFPGNYLLVIKSPGCIVSHIPLKILPQQHVRITPDLHPESEYLQNFYQIKLYRDSEYSYFVSKYEVSCEEYSKFLNDPEIFQKFLQSYRQKTRFAPRANSQMLWRKKHNSLVPNRADRPVVGVSWHDAIEYCSWLTKKSNGMYTFRLLSSQEWEWLAGKVENRKYPWGNQFDWVFTGTKSLKITNKINKCGDSAFDTSFFRLEDMASNVREWCDASSDKDYASIKGGCWQISEKDIFAINSTSFFKKDYTAEDLGFRIIALKKK